MINPNILLLDGLTRAGKFLLGKVVSHFERVEFFQFSPLLDYIPIYWRLGCLSPQSVAPMLRTTLDLFVYERSIGRHLNTRIEDDTAIHKAPDYERYLKRAIAPRGIEACDELLRDNRYSTFLTHEVLPNVRPYFEAYPKLKMINLQRHPVDLIHSWHRKGIGETFGTDPVVFQPLIQSHQMAVPWFASEWVEAYERMNPVDRVIKGVLQLLRYEQETYDSLPTERKKQIVQVSYEGLISGPESTIRQISEFLGTSPLKEIRAVLKRERCFRDLPVAEREKKYEELAAQGSKEFVGELGEASKDYEARWNLEPMMVRTAMR